MRKESQHHIMEGKKGLAFYFIFTLGIGKPTHYEYLII